MDSKQTYQYRSDIEAMRILASILIVCIHSINSTLVSYCHGGLIFFVILSVYFAALSKKEHCIKDRIQRFVFPYIIWNFMYGLLKCSTEDSFFTLTYGDYRDYLLPTSIHLWFLPFIAICLVLIDGIKKTNVKNHISVIAVTFSIIMILTAPLWRKCQIPEPLAQYAQVTPAIGIGIFIAWREYLHWGVFIGLLMCLIISCFIGFITGNTGIINGYIIGLCLAVPLLFTKFQSKHSRIINFIASQTFQIYIFHPFIYKIIYKYFIFNEWFLAICTFVVSGFMAIILNKMLPKILLKYSFIS